MMSFYPRSTAGKLPGNGLKAAGSQTRLAVKVPVKTSGKCRKMVEMYSGVRWTIFFIKRFTVGFGSFLVSYFILNEISVLSYSSRNSMNFTVIKHTGPSTLNALRRRRHFSGTFPALFRYFSGTARPLRRPRLCVCPHELFKGELPM